MSRWANMLMFSNTGRSSEIDESHIDAESSSSYLSSMAKLLLCADSGQSQKREGSDFNKWIPLVHCIVGPNGNNLEVYLPREECLFGSSTMAAPSEYCVKTLAELRSFQSEIDPHPMLAPMSDVVKLDEKSAARYSAYFSTCLTLGEPWCAWTREFFTNPTLQKTPVHQQQRNSFKAVRASSLTKWFLFIYLPLALVTYTYLLMLTALHVISSRDWANGGACLAVLTTPLVFTILLALFLPDASISNETTSAVDNTFEDTATTSSRQSQKIALPENDPPQRPQKKSSIIKNSRCPALSIDTTTTTTSNPQHSTTLEAATPSSTKGISPSRRRRGGRSSPDTPTGKRRTPTNRLQRSAASFESILRQIPRPKSPK